MKKRHTTTLEIYAKTIRMRAAEKRALRERLVSYMEYHPARVTLREADTPRIENQLAAEPYFLLRFSSWQFRAFSGVFAVILLVGTPLIAEHAVPGDVLYAMKIHVNEEVKTSLAWTPAERIAWQAERVERRIAEARQLAKDGELTTEAEEAIAATVREHAENATREIAALRSTDAEGAEVAQVALESALDVQTALLTSDAEDDTDPASSIDSLAATVAEVRQGVGAHEPNTDPTFTYERMAARLESETTRARELRDSLAETLNDTEKEDIDRRLADIERSVGDARTTFESGDAVSATTVQRTILSDIQKLVSFMTDIDVRTSLSLEEIVPKKLTREEQLAVVASELDLLKNDAVHLREVGETITDKEVLTKYTAGEKELDEAITQIGEFYAQSDAPSALPLIAQARTIVFDLDALAHSLTEGVSTDEGTTPGEEAETGDEDEGAVDVTTASTTESTTTPEADDSVGVE